jgi:aldose 1-epimerase
MKIIELQSGDAVLSIIPEFGGALTALTVAGRPLLRGWSGDFDQGPFALASNILVPFSNRIAKGQFSYANEDYLIAANLPGDIYPIHGDGFQKPWQATLIADNVVELTLSNGAIGPFAYHAVQRLTLLDNQLLMSLKVTNKGPAALPFGCGFHPWFPRDEHTQLEFAADGVWLNDDEHIPSEHEMISDEHFWNFKSVRNLPDDLINNGFTDWNRSAAIIQGPKFVSVRISASDNLSTALVYSPNKSAPFFCFEPVSHPTNAYNLPGLPGLQILEPEQSMEAWTKLDWDN